MLPEIEYVPASDCGTDTVSRHKHSVEPEQETEDTFEWGDVPAAICDWKSVVAAAQLTPARHDAGMFRSRLPPNANEIEYAPEASNVSEPDAIGATPRSVSVGHHDCAAIAASCAWSAANPSLVSQASVNIQRPTTSPPHGCTVPQGAPELPSAPHPASNRMTTHTI